MDSGNLSQPARSGLPRRNSSHVVCVAMQCVVRVDRKEGTEMMPHMMMNEGGGIGMMLLGWVAGLLILGLVGSLIVLTWVVIGHLRRQSMTASEPVA